MRRILITVAVTAFLFIGCAGIGGYRLFKTFAAISKEKITQKQFDAWRVGQSEADIRQALPRPLDASVAGQDTDRNDVPAGAACVYYLTDAPAAQHDTSAFRFCFMGGRLTDKRTVTIGK